MTMTKAEKIFECHMAVFHPTSPLSYLSQFGIGVLVSLKDPGQDRGLGAALAAWPSEISTPRPL